MEEFDCPADFRCPISMELMSDPVTIATGVTYERKNIEKWFFTYKKTTCPATMQLVHSFDITPNHTLRRLILAWQEAQSPSSLPPPTPFSAKHDELISLLSSLESSPFKVTALKKLRSIVEIGEEIKSDFIQSGGVEIVARIIVQILIDFSDYIAFRACEEALGLLHNLPLSEDQNRAFKILSKTECMKSMAIVLQRGSNDSRLYAVTIFREIAKSTDYDWNFLIQDQGIDFFKSLLELVSDDICSRASSCSLKLLIEILDSLKKSRLKAIESGAVCVLIELLPDSNGSKCEKILRLIKLLCECAEGRQALAEHGLGIAAVSKKLMQVSYTATKIVVKIMWLIGSFHPTEKVLEEMLMYGSVKKLLALLHLEGRSSTKEKVIKILKLHGNYWSKYPCFPQEMKNYLGFCN
ncbi:hypothetical protein SLA2020_384530 [Shorea laevis]